MNKKQIVKIIKKNKRYKDNEDLLDDFLESSTQKLNGIIEDIDDEEVIKNFVEKIITKSIVEVLKENNRFKSFTNSNVIQKVDYSEFAPDISKTTENGVGIAQLKNLYSTLKKHDESEGTNYLEILKSHYVDNKSIEEIAQILEIDQTKVADIIFEMSEQTNKVITL